MRDPVVLSERARADLQAILAAYHELRTVYEFRERLRELWSDANLSNERLLGHFREWVAQAETSGIRALQEFAQSLRGYGLKPG